MPFGSDEAVVVDRMRSALGEPSNYETYEPRDFGEGGCFRMHTAVLTYGNLDLRFFEGRLGVWSLNGAGYASEEGSVTGLAPSDGASLGEQLPHIAVGGTAETEDFFHFYGQEFARSGDAIAKAETDGQGVVTQVSAISLPTGQCVLVD